jgi:hypothetical protein
LLTEMRCDIRRRQPGKVLLAVQARIR